MAAAVLVQLKSTRVQARDVQDVSRFSLPAGRMRSFNLSSWGAGSKMGPAPQRSFVVQCPPGGAQTQTLRARQPLLGLEVVGLLHRPPTRSARGLGPVLSGWSGPHKLGQRRSTASTLWDDYGPLVRARPMVEITSVASLFQKAGRIGVILLRPVDDFGHPGGTPIPTHFVRREFSPPIIRDRAGAIRPDFPVCVESRARRQGGHLLL